MLGQKAFDLNSCHFLKFVNRTLIDLNGLKCARTINT